MKTSYFSVREKYQAEELRYGIDIQALWGDGVGNSKYQVVSYNQDSIYVLIEFYMGNEIPFGSIKTSIEWSKPYTLNHFIDVCKVYFDDARVKYESGEFMTKELE